MAKKGASAAPAKKGSGFDAKKYERPGLTEDEILEIKEAFDLFDSDQSGAIDINELKQSMISLGFQAKNATIYQMIADLDEDGNGQLDFPEFLNMMTARLSEKDSKADIEKVYKLFEETDSGHITLKSLKAVAKELGEEMSDQELNEILERADLDRNGKVELDDFYNIMVKKTFA